ncbi:hypothetical protein NMY22_g7062 [Coprinellus aureogranulatus]|nr:hypothetical protein NMY22_g7062 [Coprinellus aureogranulatus]
MARAHSSKTKVGADGLTKDQRYYRKKQATLKAQARERMRRTRARIQKGKKSCPNDEARCTQQSYQDSVPVEEPVAQPASQPVDLLRDGGNTPPEIASLSPGEAVKRFWELEDSDQLEEPDMLGDNISGVFVVTQLSDGTVTPDNWASTGVGEWDRFRSDLHPQIMRWCTPWGGVSAWSETFEVLFQTACRVGARFTDKHWLKKIWGHAAVGRQLLALLRHTNLPLPEDPEAVRLLWTKKMDDAEILIKGVTIIETRFDILARGMFSVPGDPVDDEDVDVDWERPRRYIDGSESTSGSEDESNGEEEENHDL